MLSLCYLNITLSGNMYKLSIILAYMIEASVGSDQKQLCNAKGCVGHTALLHEIQSRRSSLSNTPLKVWTLMSHIHFLFQPLIHSLLDLCHLH